MTPAQRAAALRLADWLDSTFGPPAPCLEAAALLRELAAEPPNCDDFDKLAAEVEADFAMRPHIEAGRQWVQQALAEPQGEPVATNRALEAALIHNRGIVDQTPEVGHGRAHEEQAALGRLSSD